MQVSGILSMYLAICQICSDWPLIYVFKHLKCKADIPREQKKTAIKILFIKGRISCVEILHKNWLVTMELEKNLEHNTS